LTIPWTVKVEVVNFTKFDEKHCHKWALLLNERRRKIDRAYAALDSGDFNKAKKLTHEAFHELLFLYKML